MPILSSSEIKEKILARESFWVATNSERVMAQHIAGNMKLRYTTSQDDRGGFYVCHIVLPKRGKK